MKFQKNPGKESSLSRVCFLFFDYEVSGKTVSISSISKLSSVFKPNNSTISSHGELNMQSLQGKIPLTRHSLHLLGIFI